MPTIVDDLLGAKKTMVAVANKPPPPARTAVAAAASATAAAAAPPLPQLIGELRNIFLLLSDYQFESECEMERKRRYGGGQKKKEKKSPPTAAAATASNNSRKRLPTATGASPVSDKDPRSRKKQKTTTSVPASSSTTATGPGTNNTETVSEERQLKRQRKQFDDRYAELLDFYLQFSHVKVPGDVPQYASLYGWVCKIKCEWRKVMKGQKSSTLDASLIQRLIQIGLGTEQGPISAKDLSATISKETELTIARTIAALTATTNTNKQKAGIVINDGKRANNSTAPKKNDQSSSSSSSRPKGTAKPAAAPNKKTAATLPNKTDKKGAKKVNKKNSGPVINDGKRSNSTAPKKKNDRSSSSRPLGTAKPTTAANNSRSKKTAPTLTMVNKNSGPTAQSPPKIIHEFFVQVGRYTTRKQVEKGCGKVKRRLDLFPLRLHTFAPFFIYIHESYGMGIPCQTFCSCLACFFSLIIPLFRKKKSLMFDP